VSRSFSPIPCCPPCRAMPAPAGSGRVGRYSGKNGIDVVDEKKFIMSSTHTHHTLNAARMTATGSTPATGSQISLRVEEGRRHKVAVRTIQRGMGSVGRRRRPRITPATTRTASTSDVTGGRGHPDGEVFIDDTPPPPRRPARRQARAPDPRSRREEPLRWDPLSRGRGLFLKQTLPEKTPGGPVHRPTSSL
jgi:hypothetical protein